MLLLTNLLPKFGKADPLIDIEPDQHLKGALGRYDKSDMKRLLNNVNYF
jgi:hypothetical protein